MVSLQKLRNNVSMYCHVSQIAQMVGICFRDVVGKLSANLDQENLDPIKFSEMSKVGSRLWRKLSKEDMKEWNECGQLAREDEDCETAEPLKCAICDKHFKLRKEFSFHEKNCCACQCQHCGKSITTNIALRRHKKRYTENSNCEECGKLLSSKQALTRHLITHINLHIACPNCTKEFASKQNMLRNCVATTVIH